MDNTIYYSRISKADRNQRERLEDHLARTAYLAADFADKLSCKNIGVILGLLHDAGKATDTFLKVLDKEVTGINHEAAGAILALMLYGKGETGSMLADIIYGHHKGIIYGCQSEVTEALSGVREYESRSTQRRISAVGKEDINKIISYYKTCGIFEKLTETEPEKLTFKDKTEKMLFYRMLLSVLVDADYTTAAEFGEGSCEKDIDKKILDTNTLIDNLKKYRAEIAEKSNANSELNKIRDLIFESCEKAAEREPGLFTLTAPTGTGKTLALLMFAARHAKLHDKKRIIIVLPQLSIISQNAAVYRKLCSDVLEIHSNTECENGELHESWSEGLIITTSVMFFESLFAHKPSECRRLHNFTDSVIVFDEAHSFNSALLLPTLSAVNTLCEKFNSTVVYSSAAQPEYSYICNWMPREITYDICGIFSQIKRNRLIFETDKKTPLLEIAEKMSEKRSTCCIVNLREHASRLYRFLIKTSDKEECFHISANMCAAHRDDVILEVKKRLESGQACRVAATTCIEAGVDLDFEYMFRAMAPLEGIIQAAGRCNRNRIGDGEISIFIPDEKRLYPEAWYEYGAHAVHILRSRHEIDILNPMDIKEYYQILFQNGVCENKALLCSIENCDFEMTDRLYKVIDKKVFRILVPYKKYLDDFNALKKEALDKGISRKWQRRANAISVSVYNLGMADKFCEPLYIKKNKGEYKTNYYVLKYPELYDEKTGFIHGEEGVYDNG